MLGGYSKAFKYAKKLYANKNCLKIGLKSEKFSPSTAYEKSKKLDAIISFIEKNQKKFKVLGNISIASALPYALYKIFDYRMKFDAIQESLVERYGDVFAGLPHDQIIAQVGSEAFEMAGTWLDPALVAGAGALVATGVALKKIAKTDFRK